MVFLGGARRVRGRTNCLTPAQRNRSRARGHRFAKLYMHDENHGNIKKKAPQLWGQSFVKYYAYDIYLSLSRK